LQIIGSDLEIHVVSESTNAASSIAVASESETIPKVATTTMEATEMTESTERSFTDAPVITIEYAESTITTAASDEWTGMSGTAYTSEIRCE